MVCPGNLEAIYEDVDWVSLEWKKVPSRSSRVIARHVQSVRRAPFLLTLAALKEEPQETQRELEGWLGSQAWTLKAPVTLIEVFCGEAPLSAACQRQGSAVIRVGLQWGHDLSRARDRS